MFISILGRQPGLSLAELEVLFGAEKITKLSDQAALIDDKAPDINKLGGSIKILANVHRLKTKNWPEASNEVTKYLKNHALSHGGGKMTIGLSVYGDSSLKPKDIQKYLINTKKDMRSSGFSVRVIPNKATELNSAQVLHNKLTLEKNAEVVLVKTASGYWIGRTFGVQNIEALARRDQGRPKRDSRVGMLPPKLALTMVNLSGVNIVGSSVSKDASGLDEYKKESSNGSKRAEMYAEGSSAASAAVITSRVSGTSSSPRRQADSSRTVLDPFCGTGVVLQESLLLGHNVYGTDLEERMIDYSKENLNWIKTEMGVVNTFRLEQGDAQYHKWTKPFSTVVCETYLGPPMSSTPAPDKLAVVRSEVNTLLKTFLRNIHKQLNEGAPLCVAVPAWHVGGKILHLNLLDDLEKLGYTRRVLKHASNEELIYRRPNQTVAREILILERN